MSSDDLDDRAWFVFRLPEATRYVPAGTEAQARSQMRVNSYENAPIDTWPLIGTRFCSREALTHELLRKSPRAEVAHG